MPRGLKTIEIVARTAYPVVTAYEFEFLRSEEAIQELLKPCTIYFVLQRPLIHIDNLRLENGTIEFEIVDGTQSPLRCKLEPLLNGFGKPGEELQIKVQFYKRIPDQQPPYRDVACFQIFEKDGKFLGWMSPQTFLYYCFTRKLKASIEGDIAGYLDYRVHYIGKAFSQRIWNRLTGHEKMQSILTREDALNTKSLKASFEISLLMLDIVGYNEGLIFPANKHLLSQGTRPIYHELNNDIAYEHFARPTLDTRAAELTNEVEAMLISLFRPQYNDVTFDNYPDIKTGTRSSRYSESSLLIEQMPVKLYTDQHVQEVVLPSMTNWETVKNVQP